MPGHEESRDSDQRTLLSAFVPNELSTEEGTNDQEPPPLGKAFHTCGSGPLVVCKHLFPAVITREEDDKPDYWRPTARGWDKMLPECVGDADVRAVATRLRNESQLDQPLPLQCAVGPAVPTSFCAHRVTWLLFLLVPAVAYNAAYCSTGDKYSTLTHLFGYDSPAVFAGQAVYHSPYVWACVGPCLLYLLWLEWKVSQHVIVPLVQVTGGFLFFGFRVGFYPWLLGSFGMSLISHLDLVTNGVFLAMSWAEAMVPCNFGPQIDCIWTQVLRESIFGYIPWLTRNLEWSTVAECVQVPFRYLVFFGWAVMLTQALYGLAGAVPLYHLYHNRVKQWTCLHWLYLKAEAFFEWDSHGLSEEMRLDPWDDRWKTNQQCHDDPNFFQWYDHTGIEQYWDTDMQDNGSSHKTTAAFLAEMVNYKPRTYEQSLSFIEGGSGHGTMYQTFLDETARSYSDHGSAVIALASSCRMFSITGMQVSYSKVKIDYYLDCLQDEGPAYGITKRLLHEMGHKVVLMGILQNGLQINLQITLFAMTSLIERHGRSEPLGFDNIQTLFEVNCQMLFSICVGLCMAAINLWKAFSLCIWLSTVISKTRSDHKYLHDIKCKYKLLTVALFVYCMVLLLAILKIYQVFTCNQSLFTFSGCVVIRHTSAHGFCPARGNNVTRAG